MIPKSEQQHLSYTLKNNLANYSFLKKNYNATIFINYFHKLTLDYCTMLLLEYKPLLWYLNITFQSAALWQTHFAGVKHMVLNAPILKYHFSTVKIMSH